MAPRAPARDPADAVDVAHGQLDGVLAEPVQPRPGPGGDQRAVHAQAARIPCAAAQAARSV